MNDSLITALLEDLKSSEEIVRDRATQELWRIWFEQKGINGLETLRHAQILLESGNPIGAEVLLTELIEQIPDFAEAWNRRAVLYYTQGKYRLAIRDCERAVHLNPIHFGALHGLGLSYMAVADYRPAIRAFRQALILQPYSVVNQRLILECTFRL